MGRDNDAFLLQRVGERTHACAPVCVSVCACMCVWGGPGVFVFVSLSAAVKQQS